MSAPATVRAPQAARRLPPLRAPTRPPRANPLAEAWRVAIGPGAHYGAQGAAWREAALRHGRALRDDPVFGAWALSHYRPDAGAPPELGRPWDPVEQRCCSLLVTSFSPPWGATQRAAAVEFGLQPPPTCEHGERWAAPSYAAQRPALRAWLRVVYRETQQWLRERGVRHVLLWRGEQRGEGAGLARVDPDLRPIVSFAVQMGDALSYARGRPQPDAQEARPARLLCALVPAARVLGLSLLGIGSLASGEVLVLGGRGDTAWAWAWERPACPAGSGTAEDFLGPRYDQWQAAAGGPTEAAYWAAVQQWRAAPRAV